MPQYPNDIHSPFGTYTPRGVFALGLKATQSMPVNGLGRRLALWIRKIVLLTWPHPAMDAVVDGHKWRIYLGDNVSERKFLFMPQFFDRAERDLLKTTLKPGDIFVDIGANAGTYTVPAAGLVGPRGRVLAFEPNPVVMERLHTNLLLNNLSPQVTRLGVGVADQVGTFDLHLDAHNLGGSSLHHGQGGQVLAIPCRPLLDVLSEQNVTHVTALKIDIEGAEDRALIPFLTAAPDSLLPRLIITENSTHVWQGDVLAALAARGYRQIMKTKMNLVFGR